MLTPRGTIDNNIMKSPEPKHELVIKRHMSTTGGERTDIVASFRVPDQSAFAKKSTIVSANTKYRRGVYNYVTIGSPDIGPLIHSTVVGMDEEYQYLIRRRISKASG